MWKSLAKQLFEEMLLVDATSSWSVILGNTFTLGKGFDSPHNTYTTVTNPDKLSGLHSERLGPEFIPSTGQEGHPYSHAKQEIWSWTLPAHQGPARCLSGLGVQIHVRGMKP